MEKNENVLLESAKTVADLDLKNPNYYGDKPDLDVTGNPVLSERPLHLFTASAGSGKTWRLAFEYISLLLKDAALPSEKTGTPCVADNYRHILAITFTNKATAEMKDRILKNLEMLSDDNFSDEKERKTYLGQLSARLNVPPHVVAARAKLVYANLLHDYSHFHIQTIDSFFQSVLRNLAQELGIGSYWEVELDTESVLADAAHRLLNRVKEDEKLRSWVTEYVKDKLDDNKNWNIEGELVNFGANLFSEALITNDEMDDFLRNKEGEPELRERISSIKKAIAKAKAICKDNMCSPAKAFVDFCVQNAIPAEHFSRGTIYNYMLSLSNGSQKSSRVTADKFLAASTSEERLAIAFSKKFQPQYAGLIDQLHSLFVRAVNVFDDEYPRIVVFNQFLKNINQIGLLADIKREVASLQAEQNVFMLAYAQPLLHKFITNDDAPFVFERIGESLRYMMIDEFQDTSKIQFQNFRPLIQNCCAENAGSLIVGDAKQAIYRFRNGDWTLIESLRKQSHDEECDDPDLSMETPIHGHDMQFNYRSSPVVVDFNNAVFRTKFDEESKGFYKMPFEKSVVSLLQEANVEHTEYLEQVYSTSHQFSNKEQGGYVKVKFHKKESSSNDDDNVSWQLKALLAEVQELKRNGVDYGDITILSRFNKEIPVIADFLTENGIPVVSDLAFMLRSSIRVRLIIDALRFIDAYFSRSSAHPKDQLYKKEMACDYLRFTNSTDLNADVSELDKWCDALSGKTRIDGKGADSIPNLPVYDMVEEIYCMFFGALPTDEYVQTFFDYLREFLSRRVASVSDVLKYWDDKLANKCIPADPKKSDKIKMYSIHKSKGLEGHTVILANCSWSATTDRNSSFWCGGINKLGADLESVNSEIPMIPVDFTDNLQDTTFADEYWEEMAQLHAENVNLLYVALTRAKHNLIVIDEYSIPKNETGVNYLSASMGRLLYEIFDSSILEDDDVVLATDDISAENTEEVDKCFKVGEIVRSAPKNDDEAVVEKVDVPDTFPVKGHFLQSSAANSFVVSGKVDSDGNAAEFGVQMHALLSYINTFADINDPSIEIKQAVDSLVLDGLLNPQQAVPFENEASKFFGNLNEEYKKAWFDAKLKVFNETGIILCGEYTLDKMEEKRPDRLTYDSQTNTYTVVDYKTGGYSKTLFDKSHSVQVARYMELVSMLSPGSKVNGFVWYLKNGKVMEVI